MSCLWDKHSQLHVLLQAAHYGVQHQTAAYPHELPEPERPASKQAPAAAEQSPVAAEDVGSWVPPQKG